MNNQKIYTEREPQMEERKERGKKKWVRKKESKGKRKKRKHVL